MVNCGADLQPEACAIHYGCSTAAPAETPIRVLERKEWAFLSMEFQLLRKTRMAAAFAEVRRQLRVATRGRQSLRDPPSLLIQHLNTQRSAELGGKQLRVFGTLCLGLISCVISSSPFSPLPSAPFPCLFLSGKEQLYQSIQYKISLFTLPRASVPDIWENAAFCVKRHQYTVFIATASDSGALDRNTKAILDKFFEQRN